MLLLLLLHWSVWPICIFERNYIMEYDIVCCNDGVTRAVKIVNGTPQDPSLTSLKVVKEEKKKPEKPKISIQERIAEQISTFIGEIEGKIDDFQVIRMWQNNDGSIDETFTIEKRLFGDENFIKLDSLEESEWQTFIDQLLPKGITKLFFFDGEKIQNIADSGNEDKFIRSSFDTLLGLDLVKQLIDDIGISVLRNTDGETKKILEEIEKVLEHQIVNQLLTREIKTILIL